MGGRRPDPQRRCAQRRADRPAAASAGVNRPAAASAGVDRLDNAKAERFFSTVKTELCCDWEGDGPDIFEKDLEKYIDWYSNVRIKRCLDGSSPDEYRLSRAA
ncbi:IS3 family transposase [Senegalimassilia anaerobia]|uniref:IS3 family transposase n=1 Tax=Senegalimassilia anaerobia TaxID=1473216 RepID=UPI003465A94D